ncbi:uncharacterized protein Z519_04973 [Cladophialophora bantiana CBS 173.52]|uniref:Uncharacterized protein n=1 Tax=Cladophialophora bantiana (strain ATCC 10958 / CBS 173.52 / CDC B-1940 / NIH 8579) TaxID=1442370 RepID=A0A0D2HNM6_CLAB1|nr:uncharacterized protein Z519_04973 [Cladophialophora bantiana CBS 173.52]KIW94993.1 hypothetical protein Z519_04973 [Cladophialophora bantiana CBS 173.52]
MSSWVMLDGKGGFVPLPSERIIHRSTPRISLAITTPSTYPGNNPLAIHCSSGTVYLTNQRIVYLPEKSTPEFKSFSAPLLNLHDTHLTVPWFGPNAWQAILQPVPGGNIPATQAAVELKLTFKEGGAPDFHSTFEQIKERLQQVVSAARESNVTGSRQDNFLGNVNLDNVHLDQLPSYHESGQDRIAPNESSATGEDVGSPAVVSRRAAPELRREGPPAHESQAPSDAPPGYEETQQQSIQAELDRRLSLTRD